MEIMKKKLLFTLFCVSTIAAYSQVGIGTPLPDASTQLDVVANDKGILIPRITLSSSTDATTITNGNVLSLLVFNTAANNDLTPGYHYWDGNKWQRITNQDDVMTLIIDNETLTSISQNTIAGTITYIDEDGVPTVLDVAALVAANETLTTLVYNDTNGSLTYTDEDGGDTVIDLAGIIDSEETLTTLVDNGDGTMTYTDEEGVDTVINTTVVSNNTYIENNTIDIDGDGTNDTNVTLQDIINNINNIVTANETVTT